jgi:hypothetical protein
MAAATLPFTCPDGYLSGGEAFEQACSVLIPGYDELVRRIHEPLTVKFHHTDELAPADAAEVVRGIAVRRIAAVTDADVGLCRDTFTPFNPDEEARRLTDEDACNACRRSVERLMRDALADRMLTPYGRRPTGEMERLVIDNPEVWRREGLIPGLDSVPDDILSPGPDMAGEPFFLKLSELHDFLAALRHELAPQPTGPEPAESAAAVESRAPEAQSETSLLEVTPTASRRRRNQGGGAQRRRIRVVLKRMGMDPSKYPTEDEVSTPDLWKRFGEEYEKVEGKEKPPSKLGMPSRRTMMREVGRAE